jgi:hypothetical protein
LTRRETAEPALLTASRGDEPSVDPEKPQTYPALRELMHGIA